MMSVRLSVRPAVWFYLFVTESEKRKNLDLTREINFETSFQINLSDCCLFVWVFSPSVISRDSHTHTHTHTHTLTQNKDEKKRKANACRNIDVSSNLRRGEPVIL